MVHEFSPGIAVWSRQTPGGIPISVFSAKFRAAAMQAVLLFGSKQPAGRTNLFFVSQPAVSTADGAGSSKLVS